MRATLRSNLFNPSTGRAQRSGASTGAKRLALGSHQFNALCLCVKTVSILKAPKIFNQKTPENPGRTVFPKVLPAGSKFDTGTAMSYYHGTY